MTKLASFPEFMVTLINAFQATLVLRKMYNVLCHSLIQLPMYVHGLPLLGRMPNHRESDILLLPSDMSKSFVYRKYVESCKQLDQCYISRRKFENLWKELRPSVLTNKPATDLCFSCQQLTEAARTVPTGTKRRLCI